MGSRGEGGQAQWNDTRNLFSIDTNSTPDISTGDTTDDVLAELQRVRASVLRNESEFILADVFPVVVTASGSNSSLPAVRMEFYFTSGRLTYTKTGPR